MGESVRAALLYSPGCDALAVSGSESVMEGGILSLIGNTPLVPLARFCPYPGIELLAKLEWYNPGGSVKDRPAYRMLAEAASRGELTPDKRVIDATSGNTGIAYAWIGAAKGWPITLCLPENASDERKRILLAFGVDLILTPGTELIDGAIRRARELAVDTDTYYYPDQYSNDDNWLAHYHSTAVELWEQTGGRITHFVAGLGTAGTFMGTSRRLKEFNPDIQCISMQPDDEFHGLEGLKHMGTALVPSIYDASLADRNIEASTERGYDAMVELARSEGIMVGASSGAVAWTGRVLARDLHERGESAVICVIFPDNASKYLSLPIWDDYSI